MVLVRCSTTLGTCAGAATCPRMHHASPQAPEQFGTTHTAQPVLWGESREGGPAEP